ncbi:heavy metal-associated domain-containing protein [Lentibacillus sp. L22]|uniref:heavy-metal-associated domain-containing protein n=1 Tax=Lentibacillus TaxID=175304 RepID=UPI0022B08459|nr:heavy metal-associated domain-containing protein [Lentibacillus daqui]
MIETAYLDIDGMHCINCPIKIEKAVSKMQGVIEIEVDWQNGMGCVTFDQSLITMADIVDRIHRVGFSAKVAQVHTL